MITSLQNEQVKRARALQRQRSARAETGRFVIEGANLVQDALQANATLEAVYVTELFSKSSEGRNLLEALSHTPIHPQLVSDAVLKYMSDTVSPQGIVAVAPIPLQVAAKPISFALIIDAVSDPGNIGTILRTAAGAGVDAVFLLPGTVDVFSPKVVRGAMGAHFRLALRMVEWGQIRGLLGHMPAYLADTDGEPCYQVDWTQPCALIVSSEAHGPSADARSLMDLRVTVPMPGQIESLNVAVATGVLLYEMVRQRQATQRSQ